MADPGGSQFVGMTWVDQLRLTSIFSSVWPFLLLSIEDPFQERTESFAVVDARIEEALPIEMIGDWVARHRRARSSERKTAHHDAEGRRPSDSRIQRSAEHEGMLAWVSRGVKRRISCAARPFQFVIKSTTVS